VLIIKSGQFLKSSEKKLLRRFTTYVMDHFVAPAVQEQSTIVIRFVDPRTLKGQERKEMVEYKAWMTYDGIDHGKKHFTISVSTNEVTSRKRMKSTMKKLREAMLCIGHELVHVKQVLNHESFDYANGDVRYKGKRYTNWSEGEKYYFSPWEIESYGHELGLYKVFEMKEEAKAK
jgi:hypothetical protein